MGKPSERFQFGWLVCFKDFVCSGDTADQLRQILWVSKKWKTCFAASQSAYKNPEYMQKKLARLDFLHIFD